MPDLTTPELAQYQTDHDLLVTLNERVRALVEAVSTKNEDHEARIRALEAKQWMISGGVLVLSTAIGYTLQVFFR